MEAKFLITGYVIVFLMNIILLMLALDLKKEGDDLQKEINQKSKSLI